MPPRRTSGLSTTLAFHVVVAVCAAAVMAVADVVQAALRPIAPRVEALQFSIAGLHLAALYGLVGLALGVAAGVLAFLARRTSRGATWLDRLGARAFWTTPDPAGLARGVGALVAAALLAIVLGVAHADFTRRFHRADLAGAVLGGVALAVALVAGSVRQALASWLRRPAFRLGRLASPWVVLLATLVLGVAAAVVALSMRPEVVLAFGPVALAWPPSALVVWGLSGALLRGPIDRMPIRRGLGISALAALVALSGGAVSAATFGASNRVRSVVEQRSVIGRRVVRTLQAWSDRDGDRYAFAFGGGDCDDGDPQVHPGALDPGGDGIDQDCFAGDGTPVVAERSRGRFGRVPSTLVRPNLLVVTIDALHRGHLGVHGHERPTSPHIDAFARQAVDFVDVVPQSSRSLRSIPSMWIGNFASEIAFGPEYLWPAVEPENASAAEVIRDRGGYATRAVMATDYFRRVDGFFQGFQQVQQFDVPDPPRDRAVNTALPILRELSGGPAPWLLWVHLYNCHVPYLQDGVPSAYGPDEADRYDTEVGFADAQFQRLLDALDELGVAERTAVVLASDHGEGFGEHGVFGHSTTLYEEELRSVLMMRVPGIAPRRVEGPVGLLDVAPTLMNLAGVEPPLEMSGQSLVPLATGERPVDLERPIVSELLPDGLFPYDVKVLRRGRRKLMWWVRDGTYQLYDLVDDPDERVDLSDERRGEADELLGALRAWVAGASRAENRSDTFVSQHRLRAVPSGISRTLSASYPGMFTLAGVDVPRTVFHPGDSIPLTTFYRVDGEIDRDLFFLVDLDAGGAVAMPPHFHAWHYPLHSRYPTTRWEPGEVIRDPTPIVIPETLATPVHLTISLRVRDPSGTLIEAVEGGVGTYRVDLAEVDVVPR